MNQKTVKEIIRKQKFEPEPWEVVKKKKAFEQVGERYSAAIKALSTK